MTLTSQGLAHDCPSREDLAHYSAGKLPANLLGAVADHLSGCRRCESQLLTLGDAGDPLLCSLRQTPPPESFLEEPEYRRLEALARAIRLDPAATASRSPRSAVLAHASWPMNRLAPDLVGPYQLLDQVGQGGMGTVYRARHTRLKKSFAVKLLKVSRTRHPQAAARFFREMEAVGSLKHPNLIQATDAGESNDWLYLVMEFVDGVDLSQLVQQQGPLSVADACEVVRQAALGLEDAHQQGLVHRDVKPSNLLLGRDGLVKVLDLGLALLAWDPEPGDPLTDHGQVMGTADYMAPEQGVDSHRVDARADVYSLGCTLYKLLTGAPPFGDPAHATSLQKFMAHAQTPVPPIRARRPDVPEELAAVLERMLAKEWSARHATAAAVATALAPFAQGADLRRRAAGTAPGPVQAAAAGALDRLADTGFPERPTAPQGPPALAPVPAPSKPGRHRPHALVYAAAAAVLAAGLGTAILFKVRPPVRPPDELRTNVWHTLLKKKPEVVFWPPNPARESRWQFDPDSQELEVDCQHLGVFALGKTGHPGYKLRVGIRQTRWHGGPGIFFGCHRLQKDGKPGYECQALDVRPSPRKKQPTHPFTLWRCIYWIPIGQGEPAVLDSVVGTYLPLPGKHEVILEITVRKRGLVKVRWDGQDLPDLVAADMNARCAKTGYVGAFGVWNNKGVSRFRNVAFMPFEREK